ncbi:4F2 cell-surface antigen heavy chain-like [Drosophila miranda]|uniref:4F2 cell-surface antigen heavy chain-like n=1 Tax=Drosophila miranda TaxID=7229 RepID=UPI00143FB77F|nr:4F2 cell-surface antigen heavy chain-like [Drosophila miranda]XP_033249061.1 4F2 cell-surface antigen heavy chain-like [Drosophila miranda]
MNKMGVPTEPTFLDVQLPKTLLESPSTSTFLPDEEAAFCPLLSSRMLGPIAHPLSPNHMDTDGITSNCQISLDCKAESSSTDSSSGIAIDVQESATNNLFHNGSYQHLQNNNINTEEDTHFIGKKSKDAPSFVSWNWPLIRKCTFFIFVSTILAMCSIVVAKISTMPKSCNPKTIWYRGGVFYEMGFQDSEYEGISDIGGIINRLDYLSSLGVAAVRLNSIFLPGNMDNVTSVLHIDPAIGNVSQLKVLANTLQSRNIALLLDIPLHNTFVNIHSNQEIVYNQITKTITSCVDNGVNGFYLKGLDLFSNDLMLLKFLAIWKRIVGENRVLIINETVLKGKPSSFLTAIQQHVDLVNVCLDLEGGTKKITNRIENILANMPPAEDSTWIQWSIVDSKLKHHNDRDSFNSDKIMAGTIMQLMLPGTPNIKYEDEMNGKQYSVHKLTDRSKIVSNMISLRKRSPSIYKSVICKPNSNIQNTLIRYTNDDTLIIVRNYPRRNSFASVTNLGSYKITMDLTSTFYSGTRMLTNETDKIFFKNFEIDPFDTIVVKLDK